jgi:hypothetical protein
MKDQLAIPLAVLAAAVVLFGQAALAAEPNEAGVSTGESAGPEESLHGPAIAFKETVYDFGEVAPRSENLCKFEFTNTGDGTLKINDIGKSCGCTPVTLEKTSYQPGESGTLKVKYHAASRPGASTKRLYVNSNDRASPRVTLTVKAQITEKVTFEPRNLRLVVNKPNAGCPDITLKALDGQQFAVTGFKSPDDCLTAEVDPEKQAGEFVIAPTADMEKIQARRNGRVEIELTHPHCKKIAIPFSLVPRFRLTPASLNLIRSEPQTTVERKLYLFSNYDEEIKIESTSSKEGLVRLLRQERIDRNRYRLVLEITPPEIEGGSRMFRDMFTITINDGEQLNVPCVGYYEKQAQSRAKQGAIELR